MIPEAGVSDGSSGAAFGGTVVGVVAGVLADGVRRLPRARSVSEDGAGGNAKSIMPDAGERSMSDEDVDAFGGGCLCGDVGLAMGRLCDERDLSVEVPVRMGRSVSTSVRCGVVGLSVSMSSSIESSSSSSRW